MAMFQFDGQTGAHFEDAVRQVARNLYPSSISTGSTIIDGRERDEVINTGTEIIVFEATKWQTVEKTQYDYKKSFELIKKFKSDKSFDGYNFRILLITQQEPTPHQKEFIKNSKKVCPVEIISFGTFYSKLFDARNYLRLRDNHFFGSIRNPADEADLSVAPADYIPTSLIERGTGLSFKSKDLSEKSLSGGRFVLLGDYGSGKSMSLRDIFIDQRAKFISGATVRCPVYINLREHAAQPTPQEILYRHSDKIGLVNQQSLIAAWRTGFVNIFLDGFDELTPPQFAVSVSNMRHARRLAVETVAKFFVETPTNAAIFLAGRLSYFDSYFECLDSLGIPKGAQVFDLEGFDQADIERYLKKSSATIPDWLPSRPLLLGYLANSGFLSDDEQASSLFRPDTGWDYLLERSCQREAKQIWGAASSGRELRLYVERLATAARSTIKGLSESDMAHAFQDVFGRDPDFPARLLTVRLPGLGAPAERETREFIDSDFGDVAASGDFTRYVLSPFDRSPHFDDLKRALGPLGLTVAKSKIDNVRSQASIALQRSCQLNESKLLSSDILNLMINEGVDYTGEPVTISNGALDSISIDYSVDLSNISFKDCIICSVEFGRGDTSAEGQNFPFFDSCAIALVEGAAGHEDLPSSRFLANNEVEKFESFSITNDAVVESNLPDNVKVLITILRKLFLQAGSGRRYSALKRGLPSHLVPVVDDVLQILISCGFADEVTVDRQSVIIPMRRYAKRARQIISAPNRSDDELIVRVR